jgi:hypothetical protein
MVMFGFEKMLGTFCIIQILREKYLYFFYVEGLRLPTHVVYFLDLEGDFP